MDYVKYHGLGNDYLVIRTGGGAPAPTPSQVRVICHRNYGVGSDGVLLGSTDPATGHFRLRIINPDGSEAEKSGNGLRIFARFLWDEALVGEKPFTVDTQGGQVQASIVDGGREVSVAMGRVSFNSVDIPVAGPDREVLNETIDVEGQALRFCAATVGNPHCVILRDEVTAQETRRWGPVIENAPQFPNRTNVQFMSVMDRNNIRIEIWERGAGYTLASGSSSCAAAAVARKLGLCDRHVRVHLPGGILAIEVNDDFQVTMTGPATKVCEGTLSEELFQQEV